LQGSKVRKCCLVDFDDIMPGPAAGGEIRNSVRSKAGREDKRVRVASSGRAGSACQRIITGATDDPVISSVANQTIVVVIADNRIRIIRSPDVFYAEKSICCPKTV
jgi:hypothetical protein